MRKTQLTRREFVGGALAASLLPGLRARPESRTFGSKGSHRLFWGDLHNHNAVGYAKGSLERSIDLAREHLDFFAFTGHASWHDMPRMPGDRHLKWVRGFEAHSKHWPKTRELLHEANSRDFVAFVGYEWHSSQFGDYCVLFPEDRADLYLPDHVDQLLDFASQRGALAIPHHVGYKQGWRGANWKHFRPAVSPVVEVFSEHGCTETDRSPFPMIRHSNGGRSASNTVQVQLGRGLRFGLVASSDDHRGYPGAYGEGVLGVWARELTRESVLEAIRARRTYAATGDRIALEFSLNGQPMGTSLPAARDRQIDVRVEGQDSIHMIELVRNGGVIERHFPEDHPSGPLTLPSAVKCRIQYGWGPWAALDLDRICHWDMRLRLREGKILGALGCFQSAPFDEALRDKLRRISEKEVRLESHTTRKKCYGEDPTKAVILDLQAAPASVLTVELLEPVKKKITIRLGDLLEDNVVEFTGVFTSESLIVHRLVGPAESRASLRWKDRRDPQAQADWYYVRVTQHNGHMVWSSPIWVG
ncbi:MAG: DUF3604 domain-containing protein [Planctomycetota bacterium]|nr:DUF3604 domain-containing protein [Planctomycetota bacterium]